MLRFMMEYLRERPIEAKAYGLDMDEITENKIREILPHTVVIEIEIAPTE